MLIQVSFKYDDCPVYNSTEAYLYDHCHSVFVNRWGQQIQDEYHELAAWLVRGGGEKLTAEFPGYTITIELLKETAELGSAGLGGALYNLAQQMKSGTVCLLDADSVKRSVLSAPELWRDELLPALIEGVYDAAEHLTWNEEGGATLAFELLGRFLEAADRYLDWEGSDV